MVVWITCGMFVTGMPRSVAAGMSTTLGFIVIAAMPRSSGFASMMSASIGTSPSM